MSIERFEINVPDKTLDDLRFRLEHIRWPDQLEGTGWARGTEAEYLRALVSYWRDHYDWRKQEAVLNGFAHHRCRLDGVDVHFIHERGNGPKPMPLILTHGWPDSFVRYQKVIPMLADPARFGGKEDAFDVIVPSLPGFGFSGRLSRSGINNATVAALWSELMVAELGYERLAAAGGDMGSGVTRYLARNHPELLVGIHLTDVGIVRSLMMAPDSDLSQDELRYKREASAWIAQEGAYMSIQSTKPQTLSYGLSDSPVGVAAWIVEKFRAWSDCNGELRQRFSEDELLTNIMIYWLTNTIGSSANMYYENMHGLPPMGEITVPTGIALFPADILPPPRAWVEKHLNVLRWTAMPGGGHFTAMEEPEHFVQDVRAFYRPLRT